MPGSRLAEHFGDLQTQHHSARLGMWIFLSSEILLFGGLFALFGSYYVRYTAEFREAAHHNTIFWGSANTFVLITSSLTVALAVWALRHDEPQRAKRLVLATILLGVVFLAIKGIEYRIHAHEGLLPGHHFDSQKLHGHGAILFYTLYWFMTSVHALHLTVGIGVMSWLVLGIHRRRVDAEHPIALEVGGMYWHLVDIIWIFLWPLLYLVR
jgi:cytochrome c oxidase subunit 3